MPHLHVRGSAAGAGEREPHAGQDLALADRALKNASEELAPRHAALASGTAQRDLTVEREKHRGPVGRRVRVDEAAADRASVSHLEVADRLRGLGEQMNATELGARGDRVVRHAGSETYGAVLAPHPAEFRQTADVDQGRRSHEPQLHGRDEAHAAREDLGVRRRSEKPDGVVE